MQSLGKDHRPRVVAASLLVHVLLVGVLLWHRRVWVAPVRLPGTSRGTRLELTYLPGREVPAAPATAHIQHHVARLKPKPKLIPTPTIEPPPAAVADAAPAQAGAGDDALGEGDISIALMRFFPDPHPDLSRLPRGSRGDVILEAIIDADGHIAQLTLKQGLGYGIDETVVATVEQWTFQPAMRDGKPIASQQEFHFHYERG